VLASSALRGGKLTIGRGVSYLLWTLNNVDRLTLYCRQPMPMQRGLENFSTSLHFKQMNYILCIVDIVVHYGQYDSALWIGYVFTLNCVPNILWNPDGLALPAVR
jgi:hypothetical protein